MQQRLTYWKTTYFQNNEQGANSCPADIAPYTECAVRSRACHPT